MIIKKRLSIVTIFALSGLILSNIGHAFTVNSSLNGGNNIKALRVLTVPCSACISETFTISTSGFIPFLAYEQNGIINTVSSTSSLTYTLTDTPATGNVFYISQFPNATTVGSSGTSGYTMTGPPIASGSEFFTLTFTGADIPSSYIIQDLFSGESFILISDTDQERAEASIENINQDILRKKINHVRHTYSDHIKTLYKTGQFSLARADYSVKGLNAGDSSTGMALWFTPTHTSIKNTAMISHGSRFTGNQDSYLFGVDMVINTNVLVGGLIGYETSDTESNDKSESDSDGYVISAYAAYNFDSGFTAYGHLGYDSSNTDIEDRTIFGSLASFDGDYDSNTHFFGFGVMRSSRLANGLNFTMDLGYNYAYTDSDTYLAKLSIDPGARNKIKVDSETISEFLLNTELAQPQSWGEYYGTIGAIFDFSDQDNFTDEGTIGLNAGVGLRFNASDDLLGEVSYSKGFLRKGHNDYTISANVRYEF